MMPEVRLIDANALFLKQKAHADLFKDSDIHDDIIRRDEATMALAEILNAPTIESELVRKPEMSDADRKKCEEWCKDCEHIEMCAWYPFGGCDFRLLPKPEQSTIEPEVRHGRWIETKYNPVGDTMYCDCNCSNCNLEITREKGRYPKFCENCGARMDGGGDNG